jgi:hypothetical protein
MIESRYFASDKTADLSPKQAVKVRLRTGRGRSRELPLFLWETVPSAEQSARVRLIISAITRFIGQGPLRIGLTRMGSAGKAVQQNKTANVIEPDLLRIV